MQDADLFMGLAGIAGVFVGFGALIAVRGGGPTEPLELAPMRMMVSMAMLTIVAALAPVTLGRYDLTDHQVWALSSALMLFGWLAMFAALVRTPEYKPNAVAMLEADRARPQWLVAVEGVAWALYMLAAFIAPVVIVLGLARELEAALYFVAVVLILLGAGWFLLVLVFAQRRPATA
jgi:NADH:ubiquinone oxidoreductase subunit 4 (subunit M)